MRIGFFSKELAGLYKNGGIGTANANLATLLAKQHDVEFVYCHVDKDGPRVADHSFDYWVEHYSRKQVSLTTITFTDHGARNVSYDIWQKVKQSRYDVIIFDDYGALGFYTVCGRVAGLTEAKVVTILHSPNDWLRSANKMPPTSIDDVLECSMERYSVENSDLVLHPSQFLKSWLENYGWIFPQRTEHVNLYIDIGAMREDKPFPDGAVVKPNSIVFFGRLEERKGIDVFLRAILPLEKELDGHRVIFCGKPGHIQGKNAMFEILNRLKESAIEFTFLNDLDSEQSMRMMKTDHAVAVMPSPEDNSPCVVYECLQAHVPFIASQNSGGVELVADRGDAFIEPDAVTLREKLRKVLTQGYQHPRPVYDRNEVAKKYLRIFEDLDKAQITKRSYDSGSPLISVCVTHFNQSELLAQELSSIKTQTYQNFEVLVVDDGSTDRTHVEKFETLQAAYSNDARFKFFRTENNYLGAARNYAIREALGEFIVFCDDDNVQFPQMLELLLKTMTSTSADVAIPLASPFFSSIHPVDADIARPAWLPVGPAGLDASLTNNCFGDANAMFRRKIFDEIGFLDEEYGFTAQDWQFFVRASLAGKKIILVPEQLSFYRVREESMFRNSGAVRNYMPVWREYASAKQNAIRQSLFMFVDKEHQPDVGSRSLKIDERYGIRGLRDAIFDKDSSAPKTIEIMYQFAAALGLRSAFPAGISTTSSRKASPLDERINVLSSVPLSHLVKRYDGITVDGHHSAVGLMSQNSVFLHALKKPTTYKIIENEFGDRAGFVHAILYSDHNSASAVNFELGRFSKGNQELSLQKRGELRFDRDGTLDFRIKGVEQIDNAKLYALFAKFYPDHLVGISAIGSRMEKLYAFDGRSSVPTTKVNIQYWDAVGFWGGLYLHPVVGAPAELLVRGLPSAAHRVRFKLSCSSNMPMISILIRDESATETLFAWEIDGSFDGSYIEVDVSAIDSSRMRIQAEAIGGSHSHCGLSFGEFMVA